jgi:hypothetical protein
VGVRGTAASVSGAAAPDPGALVRVTLSSKVGVLLDEFAAGTERASVVAALRAQGGATQANRALLQANLAKYRLLWRGAFYSSKGSLPLPHVSKWTFAFLDAGSAGVLETINGHSLLTCACTMPLINTYVFMHDVNMTVQASEEPWS